MTKTIMIIDHDAFNGAIKFRLEKEGFSVLLAGDDTHALERVKEEGPDLIIADLTRLEMLGFKILKLLKGDPKTADIPVIVLTTMGDRESRERSKELGAVGFFAKPFNLSQLVAKVREILKEPTVD